MTPVRTSLKKAAFAAGIVLATEIGEWLPLSTSPLYQYGSSRPYCPLPIVGVGLHLPSPALEVFSENLQNVLRPADEDWPTRSSGRLLTRSGKCDHAIKAIATHGSRRIAREALRPADAGLAGQILPCRFKTVLVLNPISLACHRAPD